MLDPTELGTLDELLQSALPHLREDVGAADAVFDAIHARSRQGGVCSFGGCCLASTCVAAAATFGLALSLRKPEAFPILRTSFVV